MLRSAKELASFSIEATDAPVGPLYRTLISGERHASRH
jgi:hypothetical protein